jgi:sigma-B regulation protein RsbU (phosphoserine phosphatase)
MTRVLVVEDEPGIALGLEDSLRLEGYQVEVVTNGARASRRALEEPFDLILLDVMLPGKNGFDVCRELRRSGFEAPIIFLTARTVEGDRIEGLDLGANDYVTKPFSPKELMARVRGLLRFVENNRQDRKRIEREVGAASEVQRRLFPSTLPAVAGLDYAGMCRPASGVSGDYYDYFLLPSGSLALLVADVCGKGMPAALVAAALHATVRAHAPAAGSNSGELLAEVNRTLFATTSSERFVTMFYAVYNPLDRTLTWSNAGHCPPLWVRSSGKLSWLESQTMPAGIVREIPAIQETIRLAPDDLLLAYSDGVTEARNPEGEEFGETRLQRLARAHSANAAAFSGAILDAVHGFVRGGIQEDDLTVLTMKAVL